MISEATALKLGASVTGSSQRVNQADGKSPLQVKGETRLVFHRGDRKFHFEGLVIGNLDVEVLAGTPFMEQNDIALRPAQKEIVFSDGHKCKYYQKPLSSTHTIFRAHVLRAPHTKTTLYPGGFLELDLPSPYHNQPLAIEPRVSSGKSGDQQWLSPNIIGSVDGRIRIANLSTSPVILQKNKQFAQILPVNHPKISSEIFTGKVTTANGSNEGLVRVDPDGRVDLMASYRSK